MPDLDLPEAYRQHAGELLGFAINATGDRGLAEECVQDTFTRAWQARDRYDAERASPRTWLFAIARNVVLDRLRSRGRAARHLSVVPVDEAEPRTPAGAPEDVALVEDRLTLVWALAQLSPEHRRVVVAVRVEGVTYDQLSRLDGVPVATLRTRMYHALRALRAVLEPEGDR